MKSQKSARQHPNQTTTSTGNLFHLLLARNANSYLKITQGFNQASFANNLSLAGSLRDETVYHT